MTMLSSPNTQCLQQKKHFTFKWQLKFIAMIFFTACLFIMKIVIGHLANSMTLVADSFHMITDFVALIVGYIALRLASLKKDNLRQTDQFTFGWVRAEVLGGLINTVFLLALCFSVFVESLKRFVQPEEMSEPQPVLIVGIVSLVINFIGLFMFQTSREIFCCWCCQKNHYNEEGSKCEKVSLMKTKDRKCKHYPTWENEYRTPHTLNIRGVFLHILEHFLASAIVIVSALMNMYIDHKLIAYIDPSFTLLLVLLILHSTIPLFRETIILFMQSVPANLKVKELQERLVDSVPLVLSVHEFHIWHLGGGKLVASAHILFKKPEDYKLSNVAIKNFFHNEGISCMTFQPEFLPPDTITVTSTILSQCYNLCAKDKCFESMCCDAQKTLISETDEKEPENLIFESHL